MLRSKSPIATHRSVSMTKGTSSTVAAAANASEVDIGIDGLGDLGNVPFGIGACRLTRAHTECTHGKHTRRDKLLKAYTATHACLGRIWGLTRCDGSWLRQLCVFSSAVSTRLSCWILVALRCDALSCLIVHPPGAQPGSGSVGSPDPHRPNSCRVLCRWPDCVFCVAGAGIER